VATSTQRTPAAAAPGAGAVDELADRAEGAGAAAVADAAVDRSGAQAAQPAHSPQQEGPPAREGQLSGWGRSFVPGYERRHEQLDQVTTGAVLTRGLGRSYGDSSLPPEGVLETVGTTLADRILGFDDHSGVLHAEAGLSLVEMNRLLLPRRWFTPVTPGTQFVTLGGMVAADVHGKNHHGQGSIGGHIESLSLRVADGRIVTCGPTLEPELFAATVGGMGLTGHIHEVRLRMQRVPTPWIYSKAQRLPDVDALLDGLKASAEQWPFTVAWMDSLSGNGRGHLLCGRWAEPDEAPAHAPPPKRRITVPFEMPSGLVNGLTVKLFNTAFYWKMLRSQSTGIVHPESYFYPLDMIRRWNLAYGRRGVTQYQCVIPQEAGREPIREMTRLLKQRGTASFLTVVKDCGPEGHGTLSFLKRGTSVALDLPIDDRIQATVDALNELVIAHGGRIYLAKDGYTTAEHFRAMEPRLDAFMDVRQKWDPEGRLGSAQSARLMGDPPRR